MKKLAIVVLLVVAGCSRKVNVTTNPSTPEITASGSGAIGPREAVQRFMETAKAQDIQAMADIWGTKDGPARSTMSKEQLEPRLLYMMRCLRLESYSILSERQTMDGARVFTVEIRRGNLTPRADFTTTLGPQNRWYLKEFDPAKLNSICVAK